ncbi:hypothetical protein BGZ83_001579 [Gryganskiella cystojenkinii]|nr:hypothetical protein BGZ83_001579 [Gryganskiella cystojenkinii]
MDIEDLGHMGSKRPKVTNYNPCSVRGLKPGQIKEWCTCGLTKKGPWCDGKSHKGTTFKPLRWKVPEAAQTFYSICDCRYTTRPPFCDGLHYDLPLKYLKKIKACPRQPHDPKVTKLCEECGWAGPRDQWPELPADEETDSDEDSDMDGDDNEEKKKLQEDKKQKEMAANTPKVQLSVEGEDQKHSDMDIDVDIEQPPRGCNGSCQTNGSGEADQEVYQIAREIQNIRVSDV